MSKSSTKLIRCAWASRMKNTLVSGHFYPHLVTFSACMRTVDNYSGISFFLCWLQSLCLFYFCLLWIVSFDHVCLTFFYRSDLSVLSIACPYPVDYVNKLFRVFVIGQIAVPVRRPFCVYTRGLHGYGGGGDPAETAGSPRGWGQWLRFHRGDGGQEYGVPVGMESTTHGTPRCAFRDLLQP